MGTPAREWLIRVLLLLGITLAVAAVIDQPIAWPVRATIVGVAAAVGAGQAFRRIPWFDPRRRVRCCVPAPPASRRCALTFDDGPSLLTEKVLDILAAERVPATFFVLGTHVDRFPEVVRRAEADGHSIGIHGFDHRKLAGAGEPAVDAQVRGATEALSRAGVAPPRLYRTPHGFKSRAVFSVARRHGLSVWAWSRGIWDTDRPSPAVLVRRATRGAASGMVLLLHDGRGDDPEPDITSMVAALPAIIAALKTRGFTFVRLADV